MVINNYEITKNKAGRFELANLKTNSMWRGVFDTEEQAFSFVWRRLWLKEVAV